jgi:ribosomal protein L21
MQAVIASGGKQYLVEKDQTLELELMADAKKLEFDVLTWGLSYCTTQ